MENAVLTSLVDSDKNDSPIQLITSRELSFESPIDGLHTAHHSISNCAWVETDEGVVLVDTLLNSGIADQVADKIRENGKRLKYIIYTHGHLDHVGGAKSFLDDSPEIIAHKYVPERLEKYRLLWPHQRRIATIQFSIDPPEKPWDWVMPTRTFSNSYTFSLGGKTFECNHARAETEDHCWIWVPEIGTAFVGDITFGSLPNVGNPYKPTRFALPWIRALEAIRAKNPGIIVLGGGRPIFKGDEAKVLLNDVIEVMHSLHDQVADLINKDVPVDEMIHKVSLPEDLQNSPYLSTSYSRPEFAVYNIYRWYHGYFDHNPAHLLPRPEKEVAAEVFSLIGGAGPILDRARELSESGQAQLALQIMDSLFLVEPDNIEARKLRAELLEKLAVHDHCTMSRNTYLHFRDKDLAFLGQKETADK